MNAQKPLFAQYLPSQDSASRLAETRKFVRTARGYRTVQIRAGQHVLTVLG